MDNKLKYILIILMLCGAYHSFAQSKKLSSFSKVRQVGNPLLDSAKHYLHINPTLAFDFAIQALEKANKQKNKQDEGFCYITIGDINFKVEQYDLAIENYNKALKVFKKYKNKEQETEIKKRLAKCHNALDELDKSEAYYEEVYEDAQSTQDTQQIKEQKKNLAGVYQRRGESERAIKELEEVRQMDIEEGDIEQQYLTNQQLIENYSNTAPERALELSDENTDIAIQKQDTSALILSLQEKAKVYKSIGETEEELSTLQQSLEVRKQQNDEAGQSEDNLKISKILLEQEKLDDAIAYLERSIEQSDRTGKIETKKMALKSLSLAYDRSGNYNRALAIYKQYVNAAELSAKIREQKILDNLELMQSLSKRLQRVDMLENQKALSNKTIALLEQEQLINERSLKQQKTIIIAMTMGMLILFLAIFLVYKSSRQKRIANQLLALRSLRSQMNPHFIFNALNSVNSYISKSDERAANKYLSEFSKLMRAVMENSKFDFVSLASEVQILELYLKLEHHRFSEKFDYTFSIANEIDQENVQIPPMLIQPYIENAIWHGLRYKEEKGYLKVEIINGKNLQVIIEDNGIGRQKSKELKTKNQQENVSTGLKNINNRLLIINQVHNTNLQVSIDDLNKDDNSGTKVIIDVLSNDV